MTWRLLDILPSLRSRVREWRDGQVRSEHHVCGMRVLVENTRPDIDSAVILARLEESLSLIERHEPRRMHHLRRDVAQILVIRYACRGAYFPDTRTCLTELTFLARRDISAAVVASSIIHEGTHARVAAFRRHVGSEWREADRAREERLCRRAEIAFGRALPAELGAPVIERATWSLDLDDSGVAPAIDWTIAAARIESADRRETE